MTSNYLLKYENYLSEDDNVMKGSEISSVSVELDKLNLKGKIKKYLDIGTCTARYPIFLKQKGYMKSDGYSCGIDNDDDCIYFAKSKVEKEFNSNNKPEIISLNFSFGLPLTFVNFDLITCMLGTISQLKLFNNTGYGVLASVYFRIGNTLLANIPKFALMSS